MPTWRKVVSKGMKLSGLAVVAFVTPSLPAQVLIAPRGDIINRGGVVNPENYDAKDSNEGVYAPESVNAMDQLAKAQKMERQKEWGKSADFYQELLTSPEYARKVIPYLEDSRHRIYQYISVEEIVMQRLSRWPREGLDVYRARFEAPASALLEQAKGDDLFTLQQVFSKYFVTNSGKSAGIRLMDHYMEAGEFRAAAAIGERLLKWHPAILADRSALLYRMSLAYHLGGDDAGAKSALEDLRKTDPQAKGTVRGKDVVLVDSLNAELALPAPQAGGSASDSYVTYGGDSTRDRIPAVAGAPGAHLYSVPLSKPVRASGPQGAQLEARYKQDVQNGMTLGVIPVVDRGELFFQDGERVFGLNLESGVPLPGWIQSHGADHDGAYALPGVSGSPRTHQLTLTLTDRAVLAVMGQADPVRVSMQVPDTGETRLVCLDRETGKENWIVTPSNLKQVDLKAIQFSGSPLVIGDSVLAVGNAAKQGGAFEDCFVLSFDLNSGALRWSTSVASASTVAAAFAGFVPNFAAPVNETHLAYANGSIFVQTNRGGIESLDAYDGSINWLDIYPRNTQATMNPAFNPMFFQGGQFPQSNIKPWAFNPVMLSQGLVFTLPTEGKHLLIYDAASGREIKRIDLGDLAQRVKHADMAETDQFDTLVGVSGDKLLLAGSKTLIYLNWRTYDEDHFNDDMIYWVEPTGRTSCRGRPFLTATMLYVPTEERLCRWNLRDGRIIDEHPAWPRTWDEGEGPGNVIATSDHTIIAGADSVDVYTDLDLAKRKLDREVAQAPDDPQPRLRYAEIMYAAGDYDTSMGKLDEAIQRIGGPDAMRPGPNRDRVFNDALTFAQRLKADERPDSRKRVASLFDRADRAAYTPGQKVQYCVARGRFDETRDDAPEALKLYQQILADPAMRAVPLSDEATNTPTSADVVAQKQVAELIKKDPQIYDPIEKEAADALAKAQESKDPAKLLEVARAYPNSTVATGASLAAADAYEAAGDLRAARHVLSDVYFQRNDKSPQWPHVLEAMARTDPRTAAHMLAQGKEQLNNPELSKPLKLADGTEIPSGTSFSAALDRVRKLAYQRQDRTLPTFGLPVPHSAHDYHKPFRENNPVIANVDSLAVPLRDFARPDRVVAWSAGPLLSVYAAGSDKPLASSNQFSEKAAGCAWLNKDLLVWGQTEVAMYKNDGAELAWHMDVGRLASIEVIAADEPGAENAPPQPNNPPNNAAVLNNRFRRNGVVFNARGQAVFIPNRINVMPVPGGAPAPAVKPVHEGPEQIDSVVSQDDRVLLSTTSGRVLSLQRSDGTLAWQTRLTDRPVDRVIADGEFTIIKAGDENVVRLAVLDTFTGHVRGTRSWPRETNNYPQNIALSPDGTLVYTLVDRICFKDLYRPWDQRAIEKVLPAGQASFMGLTGPDQLIISEGRALAVSDSGDGQRAGEKFVRPYSIETGEPVMLNFSDGQQMEKALSIGTKSADVSLRMVGPRLYAVAPDAAICYNLDAPDDHYQMFDQDGDVTAHSCFIGKDYLVILSPVSQPGANAAAPAPAILPNAPAPLPQPPAVASAPAPVTEATWTLYAFRRESTTAREPGLLDYDLPLKDPAGITSIWQPLQGGLAYLSADRKVHMLMGAKE